jgi:hypothetical protein
MSLGKGKTGPHLLSLSPILHSTAPSLYALEVSWKVGQLFGSVLPVSGSQLYPDYVPGFRKDEFIIQIIGYNLNLAKSP